jgi:hypothetical protein
LTSPEAARQQLDRDDRASLALQYKSLKALLIKQSSDMAISYGHARFEKDLLRSSPVACKFGQRLLYSPH